MPRYSVVHTTCYKHHAPASAAWQALHLQPRNEPVQHCDVFELHVAPHPTDLTSRFDYFGNKQHLFTLREPHRELVVTSRSLVRRDEPTLPMPGLTPAIGDVAGLVAEAVVDDDFTLEQFLHASPLVPLLVEAGDPRLAREFFAATEAVLTELNDRLSQVFFSHSEVPEAIRGT